MPICVPSVLSKHVPVCIYLVSMLCKTAVVNKPVKGLWMFCQASLISSTKGDYGVKP